MAEKIHSGVSIIVPFYNEEGNVLRLHRELLAVLPGSGYELVYVDDGSTDSTLRKLREALAAFPAAHAKIVTLPKNLGQSFAFKAGLDNSRFPLVVFMDGDLQNDPRDISRLLDKIAEGYDLVQGVRRKRKDGFFTRVLPSLLANFILRVFCNSKFRDIGCSLKAFKKEPAMAMVFQQGMHRILPAYFSLNGERVAEITVNHRRRIYGKTKYGFSRIFEVLFEIIKINFFERNSNQFLFLTEILSFVIFCYGCAMAVARFSRDPESALLYFIISILAVYVFIISAVLYISRSFYIYYKYFPVLKNVNVESYDEQSS